MERVKGIEPSSEAWEATALPLSYTRNSFLSYREFAKVVQGKLCRKRLVKIASLYILDSVKKYPMNKKGFLPMIEICLYASYDCF